jgi:hypothetical protein
MTVLTAETQRSVPETRPRATDRDHMVLLLAAAVMEVGGLLDGWAHNSLPLAQLEREGVLSPWHLLLGFGYALTAGWIALLVLRQVRGGARGLAAVPIGYGLGLAGAVAWPIGFGLDQFVWHQVFGVERGIEALLSPTHLLLGLSEILMLTSPLRAAWSDATLPRRPSFGAFFPALLSVTFAVGVIAFFFSYEIAFVAMYPAEQVALGIPTVLTTNLLLIGTMLLLLRRWQPPFGSLTFFFGAQATLINAITGFAAWPTIPVALAGGLFADVLVSRWQPTVTRPAVFRATAALTSLTLWTVYMITLLVIGQLDWSPPLWAGVTTLAVGSSAALGLIVAPPLVPATDHALPSP